MSFISPFEMNRCYHKENVRNTFNSFDFNVAAQFAYSKFKFVKIGEY